MGLRTARSRTPAYSLRKIAVRRPTGTAITAAPTATMNEPAASGRIPKFFST
jgi:hypothetical protein